MAAPATALCGAGYASIAPSVPKELPYVRERDIHFFFHANTVGCDLHQLTAIQVSVIDAASTGDLAPLEAALSRVPKEINSINQHTRMAAFPAEKGVGYTCLYLALSVLLEKLVAKSHGRAAAAGATDVAVLVANVEAVSSLLLTRDAISEDPPLLDTLLKIANYGKIPPDALRPLFDLFVEDLLKKPQSYILSAIKSAMQSAVSQCRPVELEALINLEREKLPAVNWQAQACFQKNVLILLEYLKGSSPVLLKSDEMLEFIRCFRVFKRFVDDARSLAKADFYLAIRSYLLFLPESTPERGEIITCLTALYTGDMVVDGWTFIEKEKGCTTRA